MKGLEEKKKSPVRLVATLLLIASLVCITFMPSQDLKFSIEKDTMDEGLEVFDLTLPILYKNEVYHQSVLNHSFANSWGKPAITTFTPPDIEFNRVVLNLEFDIEGVQYDRLAHIFINDVPVWRTSTPEPGNQKVFSLVSKDISKYLPLFEGTDLELVFQLDNLITTKLTGVINTNLTISYFYEDHTNDEENSIDSIFKVTNRPAHKITKLVEHKLNRTPLLYYPDSDLVFNLPKVNQNTTNLKLSLFISGNSAEEFWYTNILDEFKDLFVSKGHEFLGHGPVRVVNIYIDDILINTIAPEPIIYSGGISPALWKPIIGINAFDIKPLEIDLSAFLPNLWNSESRLRIEVSNGQYSESLKIGENWIASCNLLHWESPKIESSYGEIIEFKNSTFYNGFGVSSNIDNLYQSVIANNSAELLSNITINFFNGTTLPLKIHTISKSIFSNFQEYASFGDSQFLSTLISSTFDSFVYLNDGSDSYLNKLNSAKVYPKVISLSTKPNHGQEIDFNVNITTIYGSNVKLNGKEVFCLESYHNGSSNYVLSPNGNHGFGSAYQNFIADLKFPFPNLKIDEIAEAVNNTIIRRDSGLLDIEEVNIDRLSADRFGIHLINHLFELNNNELINVRFINDFVETLINYDQNLKQEEFHESNNFKFNIGERILLE